MNKIKNFKLRSLVILIILSFFYFTSFEGKIVNKIQEEVKIEITSTLKTTNSKSKIASLLPPYFFKTNNAFVLFFPAISEIYFINDKEEVIFKNFYGKRLSQTAIDKGLISATLYYENLFLLSPNKITKINTINFEETHFNLKIPTTFLFEPIFYFINENEFILSYDDIKKERSELLFYKGNTKTGVLNLIFKERIDGLAHPYVSSFIYENNLIILRNDESKIKFYDFSGKINKEVNIEAPSKFKFRSTPVFYSNEMSSATNVPFSDKYTGMDIVDDKLFLTYKLFTEDIKNKYDNIPMLMIYDLKSKKKKEIKLESTFHMLAGNGMYFNLVKNNDQSFLEYRSLKKDFETD